VTAVGLASLGSTRISGLKEKWAMKIEVVKSGAPRPLANYSEAMVAGPWIFAAGQLASDFKTGVPGEARKHPNFPFYGSDIKLQTRFVLENLKKTFQAARSSLENVFKAQVFLTDLNDFFAFDEVWKEYFKVPPARTTVGTTGLLVKDTLVEIDLIGFVPGKGIDKQVIKSNAPRPLAHYNEGFKVGDFVYAAGQIASDYKTGIPADAMRSPNFPFYSSDIKLQTRYILENLKKTFEAAGSSLDNVFKAQVFLTDLKNFNGFDEVWKEYFKLPPARTTVGTTGLLVKDTLVEIDLIGCVTGKGTSKEAVKSDAPQPLANYTEAFKVGALVFAAGQLSSDFKSGVPAEARRHSNFPYYNSDIKLQTRFVLENLKQTFEAAGSSLDQVVKAQVFLTDLNNFNGFDEVWKEFFKVPPPRTTIGTTGLLVKDTLVEIDLIGVAND
jgi:reactive intermediate/imine deaminase